MDSGDYPSNSSVTACRRISTWAVTLCTLDIITSKLQAPTQAVTSYKHLHTVVHKRCVKTVCFLMPGLAPVVGRSGWLWEAVASLCHPVGT